VSHHIQSETIGNLALALAKAQGEMGSASKDANNPHFKSRYADLASIMDACRAPLAKHGLAVSQLPCRENDGSVGLTTILLHESGEFIGSSITARPAQESPQVLGSLLTYLRRYSLAAICGVVQDDDDAESATAPTRKPAPRQEPPQAFTRDVAKVADTFGATVERVERIEARDPKRGPACPVCAGDMWDNRAKKASGAVNPKAPDFGCKDKGCSGRVWKVSDKPAEPMPTPDDDVIPF
jgi:hypothetical protein